MNRTIGRDLMHLAAGDDNPRSGAGRRKGDDWKLQAPRWVLLALLMVTSGYIGVQATQNRYLNAALQDGPSKFQQRQGERLAALEAQVGGLARSVDVLTGDMKEHNEKVAELTSQMKLLTSAVNRR